MANTLETSDNVGEVSDLAGLYGNILQAADQGSELTELARGPLAPAFLPTTEIWYDVDPDTGALGPRMGQETGAVNQAFNGLGAVTSGISMWQGCDDWGNPEKSMPDRVAGAVNAGTGAVGLAGGLVGALPAGTVGTGGFLSGISAVGGSAGMGGAAFSGATWGAGSATAAGAVGTGLATGGAVLGSGAAGYGLGRYGDENMKNLGWLGKDANGRNQSISDWGADLAVDVHDWVSPRAGRTNAAIAGAATSLGTSIAGVPLAIASTATGLGTAWNDGARALRRWWKE